jgi:integrase
MAKHTGIRKLPNGRFRARYFAGYDTEGKRQYPAKTFDTQTEAIAWRSDRVSAKNPGRHYEGRALTVSMYLDRWLEIKKQALRNNSLRTYRQTLNDYVKPHVGKVPLTRLTPSQIEHMQTTLLAKVSPSTVLLMRGILGEALKKALRLGLIRHNPMAATEAPKRNRFKHYPLTVEEAVRFLDVCDGGRFGLLFRFALTTGLRPEETTGLRWEDLEFGSRGIVRVNQVAHSVPGGGYEFQKPKTANSERAIVFPSELVARLQEHRKIQLQQKLKLGQHWQDNDLVFTGLRGKPIKQCVLRKQFKKMLELAELPSQIRQYDLRHAFVTFSLVAGVDAKTVSKEAGHAHVAFTLQTYGSVLDEMHEEASDKREGLFRSRGRR